MDHAMFVVYVLFSVKHSKIYVGYTQDLISRFHSHNTLAKTGYTVKYRPWIVVHAEKPFSVKLILFIAQIYPFKR